ncbi:MAG: DNA cytosine methyltransferase [Lewinellaceae bacterium]|nr:DNA cytosine methyltransferase [Lewinellaceae bacterium]MCB9290065.1 DNA cytosine methyltransferase [Lewinellaceae bacterium]
MPFTSIEICAGAGGQAVGLEQAGFEHLALVEIDGDACNTLRHNRPDWNVREMDVKEFSAREFQEISLFAGGVPCPPFSIAGKQLGQDDERDLFPEALRLIEECQPQAVLLENVRGFLSKRFEGYRRVLMKKLKDLGYTGEWRLLTASDYGVPQLRPRAIYVGFRDDHFNYFKWPERNEPPPTVGEVLFEEMASRGWKGAESWKAQANDIAPTLVGGSKKHGGADLGPSRARNGWKKLGVDGRSLVEEPPDPNFKGMPKLTVKMASMVQGFPEDWDFTGRKTAAYRQVGNAFPPPVAKAVGEKILSALKKKKNGGKPSAVPLLIRNTLKTTV